MDLCTEPHVLGSYATFLAHSNIGSAQQIEELFEKALQCSDSEQAAPKNKEVRSLQLEFSMKFPFFEG
jgi:hypothetical protein